MESEEKKYIPGFLREKFELMGTLIFAALFSVVFLLMVIPFSDNAWFRLGNSIFFRFTVLFAFGAFVIVALSRFVMYRTRNDFPLNWTGYVLWCGSEVLVICLLYTLFTLTVARPEGQGFLPIFVHSLAYGIVCLGIPYIIAGLVFTVVHQKKIIRLINMKEEASEEGVEHPAQTTSEKITLFDNSGVLKLSISSSDLYYIESDDNYIKVWYIDTKNVLKTYMLRCRLKTVEESFKGSGLVRCHRKFIVNMNKVKALRRERDGYELDLDDKRIPPIPVTKTYTESIISLFSGRGE